MEWQRLKKKTAMHKEGRGSKTNKRRKIKGAARFSRKLADWLRLCDAKARVEIENHEIRRGKHVPKMIVLSIIATFKP